MAQGADEVHGSTLGVTVRELSRCAAALLDMIERDGRHIVIARYGRAVAFLAPLPEDYEPANFARLHVAPRFQRTATLTAEEVEEDDITDEEIADLGEEERRILAIIAAEAPDRWLPRTQKDLVEDSSPRFQLELRGWIQPGGGGWTATAKGLKAALRVLGADRDDLAGHV